MEEDGESLMVGFSSLVPRLPPPTGSELGFRWEEGAWGMGLGFFYATAVMRW